MKDKFFEFHKEFADKHEIYKNYFYDIPADEYELQKAEKILKNQTAFNTKLKDLERKIKLLFLKLDPQNRLSVSGLPIYKSIIKLIYQVFAVELHNRPFLLQKYGDLPNPNNPLFIYARNVPCEICGENRTIDRCHIIPTRFGGEFNEGNILYLCPTHHRLFDRGKLTVEEIKKINFYKKSKWSMLYFMCANLPRHKSFDKSIKNKDYGTATTEDNFRQFIDLIFEEVSKRYAEFPAREKCLEVFCQSSYAIACKCYECIKRGETSRDVIV